MKVVNHDGIAMYDYEPRENFLADVAAGLSQHPRRIPSKYFYDKAGSALFERICELPEYYLTRTEVSILTAHISEMAALLGPRCAVVEPGAGSGLKTRLLLQHLDDPVAYVPVDISRELLLQTARELQTEFAQLEVLPVCADYHSEWELPPMRRQAERNVVFFPGSTIGNMEPDEAQTFLRRLAQTCGPTCGFLLGVDLRKDPAVIELAYNDPAGVTREFNLNLVARLNRELTAGIPEGALVHESIYNPVAGRNESYLRATQDLWIILGGTKLYIWRFRITSGLNESVELAAGERILIEHSYKYSLEGFAGLAAGAGLRVQRVWTDERQWFSVQYLVPA